MRARTLWIGVIVLAVLSPLGLWLPDRLRAGDAWGEWSPDDLRQELGYLPEGMARAAGRWQAPMPDYALPGWQDRGLPHLSVAYVLSALVGMAVCAILTWGFGRWLARREASRAP